MAFVMGVELLAPSVPAPLLNVAMDSFLHGYVAAFTMWAIERRK
jgi:hypothetical protein